MDSRQVAEVLADIDLMGLRGVVPDLTAEYEAEANDIVRKVEARSGVLDEQQLAIVVEQVFRHWFDQQITQREADVIARRIRVGDR